MKRSMIAVCLVVLSPGGVKACIEDHNPGAGWFDQQPSGWTSYDTGAQVLHRDRVQDVSLLCGGLGVTILMGVFFRAMCQSSRLAFASDSRPDTLVPLVLPIDVPAFDPMCEQVGLNSEDWESSTSQAWDDFGGSLSGCSSAMDSVLTFG
jgi:hypothetical protein